MTANLFTLPRPAIRASACEAVLDARIRSGVRRIQARRKGGKLGRALVIDNAIQEAKALGEHGTMAGNNFVGVHRQLMVDGTADEESIKLLYGWFGNIITAMGERYRRGNKTLRIGMRLMARGRRALASAWRRWVRWKRVKFEGAELAAFEDAFDLGIQFTPSLSKSELRAAFRLSDARHKRFAKRTSIATYMS